VGLGGIAPHCPEGLLVALTITVGCVKRASGLSSRIIVDSAAIPFCRLFAMKFYFTSEIEVWITGGLPPLSLT